MNQFIFEILPCWLIIMTIELSIGYFFIRLVNNAKQG
jgi:hypothetical protein